MPGPVLHPRPGTDDPEAGFVGGFEGLVFGLLLFVVGTLFVANAWGVVDTAFAADAAARQAVRTFVEAPDAAAATAESRQAAAVTLAGYGRVPTLARITVVAPSFTRCARVTIDITYPAPLVALPWIGRVGTGESVTSSASELIDPFRTGLPGVSTCA